MLPLVLDLLPTTLGLQGSEISTISEAIVGKVIPDILIGGWSRQPHKAFTKLTYVDATVLALLEGHHELSTQDILSRVFLAQPTAERTFRKLVRMGATTITPEGGLRISDTHSTLGVEIIAIEFKMRRWRQALAQAETYRTFADRSFVVLDAGQTEVTPRMISAFADAEVGLLLQTGAELILIADATPRRHISSDRIVATQKLASALLNSSNTSNSHSDATFETPKAKLPDDAYQCAVEKLLNSRPD